MTTLPFQLPYGGVTPRFAGPPAHAAPGSAVLGRVELGGGVWLGTGAVIRADGHYVRVGDEFHLGACGTVHIAHDLYPTRVGYGVTAREGGVIHACDVGDRCHIGAGAVILDGSHLEAGLAIDDDAVVFPRSELASGWLYSGAPARPKRQLEPGELDRLHAEGRSIAGSRSVEPAFQAAPPGAHFVAATARLAGHIDIGARSGVWFGCALDAGADAICIGADTNIQDNTVIFSEAAPVVIGCKVTVGHNVTMTDCRIGDACLIGIGARIAAETIVEGDVLLAAGAWTEPGQHLAGGWLYGGRPAKRMKPIDEARRAMMAAVWPLYGDYARDYAVAQAQATARP